RAGSSAGAVGCRAAVVRLMGLWTFRRRKSAGVPERQEHWRATIRRRLFVAAAFLALWALGIQSRLVYLQVVARDEMVVRAERQHQRTIVAPAKRGDIVDRHGRVLATSADVDTIYAVPSEIEDQA